MPSIRTRAGAHDDVPEPARPHGRPRPGGGRATAGHTAAAPVTSFDELTAVYGALKAPAVAVMRRHLDALRPGVGWADGWEDRAAPPAEGEVWVVDVVNGAVQFLQDVPQFCVSLTLVRDGEPVAAALHAPLLSETYLAALGEGATRNGVPIGPSAKTDPAVAVVATTHPPFVTRQPEAAAQAGRSLAAALPRVAAVRDLGPTSWQIAGTAAGRLDAFWEFGCDDANLLPGALVAREAGALVTDAEGQPWSAGSDSCLVAPAGLHGQLVEALRTDGGVVTAVR
ncbi:inositol monophosphatase family protein [Streptomyces gibsoniae]|uniref:Inositol monophosphatase family protein n=1 Tax=Streptomyces gibsoniae TaxID=3075529 RepID=A0ABU2TVB4_9ACTN|nr:inositol monophosphatase family protein [Streptomyces sp. DSM 41699]MDT0464901.1 inositol monophosphatase family protein [Streptomyces sp. DSM 41699]